jgi:serine/threonine protein kinase
MHPEPPDDRSEAGWPIGAGRTTSLSDILAARGPLPPAAAAMVASQVCVALATAHARGLTYGRLTPANVLLSADGRVKLKDFWMAQAARRSTVSDPRDDLHALGRCMVVMLTGREPAAGEPVLLGPEVPTQLAVIVAGAVGDARGGYRSASDLGRDLVRFLTTARPSLALAAGRPAAGGPGA